MTLKLLSKLKKMVGSFLAPCGKVWLFSGLDLALWQKVDLATLVVTQPWVKSRADAYCWRQKLRLDTSLRFIIARFANLAVLDEISQKHSTFCKLQLLAFDGIWHFVISSKHSDLNLAPPKCCARGGRCPHLTSEEDQMLIKSWPSPLNFDDSALVCWNSRGNLRHNECAVECCAIAL